jgi:aconitate hydratase
MPPTTPLTGPFGTLRRIDLPGAAGSTLALLPWCLRVLLENVLRQPDHEVGVEVFRAWTRTGSSSAEITFAPRRILMHDTTCVPALTDIAAMRDTIAESDGDPARLRPTIPIATSVDHSIAVDRAGTPDALAHNLAREIERNAERYRFMKWATHAVPGFRVFPPGTGIMHTLNLERLAEVVSIEHRDGVAWAVPDTMIGTDSHTPMINGIGVLGWGVGGIEAEGAMFGVPVTIRLPEVVGVRLVGSLPPGVLATDLALTVTERLRRIGVAGEFVEFFGPGVASLGAGERAVVANMAPEYGATTGCFPIDAATIDYLRATGRPAEQLTLVEHYARAQGLWHDPDAAPRYTRVEELDLAALRPSLAGLSRPHDRLDPAELPNALGAPAILHRNGGVPSDPVAIAAVTSCTNTSDPGLLVSAGLLARRARARGLAVPPWVKTSLTPGSPAAARRLARAGLLDDLEALGFSIAGYGCATCIGNSGPLLPVMQRAMADHDLRPVAVLSGNRNFPGRVHADLDRALLASPPLVIAFALAGQARLDITRDPLGRDAHGAPVRLEELWPDRAEVEALTTAAVDPDDIAIAHRDAEAASPWSALDAPEGVRFPWDPASTYLRRPPFVSAADRAWQPGRVVAHPLLVLGDDVTTDHISPAGAIRAESDAGRWLVQHGADPRDLNVFASRRGNWEVMLRGLFTNRSLINHLCPDAPPGHTVLAPSGEVLPVWQAAARHAEAGRAVVVLAGERYGAGSSRDWAAKGARLLGLAAVLARSFERIHRSNLIGMGVLPLRLPEDWRPEAMGLAAEDTIELDLHAALSAPRAAVPVTLRRAGGGRLDGTATVMAETSQELALLKAGGIIPTILRGALEGRH